MESVPFRFAISATFTAEPLEPVLRFWESKLGTSFEVRFAQYNQIQQTLTSFSSEFAVNVRGLNIVLARIEDLGEFDWEEPATLPKLRANFEELIHVFRIAREHARVPMVFVLCPPSPAFTATPERARFAQELAAQAPMGLRLESIPDVANQHGERLGKVPYTDLYFCALGTALVRYADSLVRPPFKVIALDCDNTLWKGICGEDGPNGIVPDIALQRFMLHQHASGMLLVLASKNNESDVLETFERNPSMPLQLRHFAAQRLNWDSKAENLTSLAAELSLGLDSFIFVDDSGKETAEASEQVPEVLSLTLPPDSETFLPRVWAFDHWSVTEEDRKRNISYATGQQFGRELRKAGSLEHFMSSLDLRITFGTATPDRMGRIAQLTQRTNQFNFTGIRRTEAEIAREDFECLTVDVTDRFGEYGLTGVVFYRVSAGELRIDTFVLSCRVLGRGVEHRILARLGSEALSRGASTVILPFIPSAKNQPAARFLATLKGSTLDARRLMSLTWSPELAVTHDAVPINFGPPIHKRPDYQNLALSAAEVLGAMRKEVIVVDAGLSDAERSLAGIWAELLGKTSIAAGDNFFDLGGHSLLMVQMVMRVREAFGVELTVDDVYSATLTLSDLARKIEAYQRGEAGAYNELLREIEALSDEEVERLLSEEQASV